MNGDITSISIKLLFFLFGFHPAVCQNIFEGFIRYTITLSSDSHANAPESIEYYLKENHMMIRVFLKNEGELARVLYTGNDNILYMIDDVEKTAMKIDVVHEDQQDQISVPDEYREAYEKALEEERTKKLNDQFGIIETGIIENIAGYPCKKFKVTDTQNQGDTYVWITDKISFDMPRAMIGKDNPLTRYVGKDGFPLKLKITTKAEDVIIMEASKIESKRLDEKMFIIPSDYRISDISTLIK